MLLRLLGATPWTRGSNRETTHNNHQCRYSQQSLNSLLTLILQRSQRPEFIPEFRIKAVKHRQCKSTDIGNNKQHYPLIKLDFFPPQTQESYIQPRSSDGRAEGLCFVFSLAHACLCLQSVMRRQRGEVEEEKSGVQKEEVCVRATQQQHSCDCRLRSY